MTVPELHYVGPTFHPEHGIVDLGRLHGGGAAAWPLYGPGRMRSGAVIGIPGSGKTNVLNLIALGATQSGCTLVWHIDPQGGASSPALASAAVRTAWSGSEVLNLVAALARLAAARQGAGAFVPSPSTPGVLVTVEALDAVLRDRAAVAAFEEHMDGFAGAGIGFAVTVADAGLASFGGSRLLRNHFLETAVLLDARAAVPVPTGMGGQAEAALFPGVGWLSTSRSYGAVESPTFQAYHAGDHRAVAERFAAAPARPRERAAGSNGSRDR